MLSSSISIRIIGQHFLVNEALAALISSLPGIEVVGKTSKMGESHEVSEKTSPELLLWFFLPAEQHGVLSWLKKNPQLPVLLISADWISERIKTVLQAGAFGCVHSHASMREFGEAIRQISRGEIYLSPDLTRVLILESTAEFTGSSGPSLESLTPREQELLPLICQGYSNKQIAQTLYLSVRTVENHLSNIYARLGVHSRTELAILSVHKGWAELPE
jgi:DNA-binding NarL/FixJ family response regulator